MTRFTKEIVAKIIVAIIAVGLIISCVLMVYSIAEAKSILEPENEPISRLFWIDDNRVHVDSIIECTPIYSDKNEVIGSMIKVSYDGTVIFIECLTTDDYTWWEFKESWLLAFNKGIR